MPSVDDYLKRITSEHADKIRFLATVAQSVRPFADMQTGILGMPQLYDLDNAVGVELDTVGLWVGATRQVTLNTVFSFDIPGAGFDQGQWDYPGMQQPVSVLPDAAYRVLLRAKIVNNHWDGSIPLAYAIWDTLFAGTGLAIRLHDYQNMTMGLDLICPEPADPLITALFLGGYLDIKPAGVRLISREVIPQAPAVWFAFDTPGAGFDQGQWLSEARPVQSIWDVGNSIWDGGASVWDTT